MLPQPERMDRKFTDRDVRENVAYMNQIVIEYLQRYEGEFDYLVDNKMRLATGRDLTIPQIRGVLNCMRNDPRVVMKLPPLSESNVIEFPRMEPVVAQTVEPEPMEYFPTQLRACDLEGYHKAHGGQTRTDDPKFDGYRSCPGKNPINRIDFMTRFQPKGDYKYIIGYSASRIHLAAETGHFMQWHPPKNQYGWSVRRASEVENLRYRSFGSDLVTFLFRTQCDAPKVLKNAQLLNVIQAMEIIENGRNPFSPIVNQRNAVDYCGRCFPREDV